MQKYVRNDNSRSFAKSPKYKATHPPVCELTWLSAYADMHNRHGN